MALSKKDKTTIDFLLPLILTAVTGFVVFKRSKDWRVIALAVGVVFLLAYAITSQVTKRIYDKGPGDVPTGGTCDNFDPRSIADRLKSDIYSWGFRNHSIYDELIALDDCHIKSLYNYWNKNFYGKDRETLPVAIAGEGCVLDSDFCDQQSRIKTIFQRLNLS